MKILSFCSQTKNAEELKTKYPKLSILDSKAVDKVQVDGNYSNKIPLPVVYNDIIRVHALNGEYPEDNIIVLAHDDVCIKDSKWIEKLDKALEQFDIVGLAGGNPENFTTAPQLWHLMSPRETWKGEVWHKDHINGQVFRTSFGKQGRVLVLDGLFLAFKPHTIYQKNAWFDETNPCIAHFYDIDFCLTCNKLGLKMGTTNIEVVHNSPGLKEYTQEWLNGEEWFKNKVRTGQYNINQ